MTTKPPTPQGISALLRKAGHLPAVPTGACGPGEGEGFAVDTLNCRSTSPVRVWWRGYSLLRCAQLARYAEAIKAAGWYAEVKPDRLIVTAGD